MKLNNSTIKNAIDADVRMTRREAALYLNLSVGTLANWAAGNRYNLPFYRCGKKVLYLKSDLDKWLGQRRSIQ